MNAPTNALELLRNHSLSTVVRHEIERRILAGVSLGRLYPDGDGRENGIIVAVTETVTAEDIEAYASALEEVLT